MAPLMRVFGASLPMQAMDFSKMLTVSAYARIFFSFGFD
jgi:hypothetical protein